MKLYFLALIGSCILCGFFFLDYAHFTQEKGIFWKLDMLGRNQDTINLNAFFSPREDQEMLPLEVTKGSTPIILEMNAGGTQTNVRITNENGLSIYDEGWMCCETQFEDISNWEAGRYFVSYSSCYSGGNLEIIVTD